MSVKFKREQKMISKCYQVNVFFQSDCVMENIKAYTMIFGLIGLVEELYFLPEDIVDNSDTSAYIRKNGLDIFLRTKIKYEQRKDQLNKTPSLERLTLKVVDESAFETFEPVPENMKLIVPQLIIKQMIKKPIRCLCQTY